MNTLANNLLHSLLKGQNANGTPQSSRSPGAAGLSFASLLSAAQGGALSSDRPVEAVEGAEGLLTPEQLSRLGVAADHAESAGMTSALVLIDGRAVKLDVLSRQATAVVDPRTVAVTEIDGVLAAPGNSLTEQFAGQQGTAESGGAGAVLESTARQLLSRLSLPGLNFSR